MSGFDDKAKTWDSDAKKVARAEAIASAIRKRARIHPDMTAFEYGCGTGLLSFALQSDFSHITLADSSDGMLAVLNEKIAFAGSGNMQVAKLDLTTDPLPSERFDIIYTAMTLHHIEDVDGLFETFYQLLKTTGYLCVADLDKEDGSFHGHNFSGHHGFDRIALAEPARQAGFVSTQFETVYNMTRGEGAEKKDFPIFLMIARKE